MDSNNSNSADHDQVQSAADALAEAIKASDAQRLNLSDVDDQLHDLGRNVEDDDNSVNVLDSAAMEEATAAVSAAVAAVSANGQAEDYQYQSDYMLSQDGQQSNDDQHQHISQMNQHQQSEQDRRSGGNGQNGDSDKKKDSLYPSMQTSFPNGGTPVRKCSRCRVKRLNEDEESYLKYRTCLTCRVKRKIQSRKVRDLSRVPNLYTDFEEFLQRIRLNTEIDILQHNYRGYAASNVFVRYKPEEVTPLHYKNFSKMLINTYIIPLMLLSGFRFAIRDFHKSALGDETDDQGNLVNSNKPKKISFMFVCSQDKNRQRKSRSENKRQVINKLKTESCDSKVSLNYDLASGFVQIGYTHRCHLPYNWKRTPSLVDSNPVGGIYGVSTLGSSNEDHMDHQIDHHHHHEVHHDRHHHQVEDEDKVNADVSELSKLLKQSHHQLNEQDIAELAARAAAEPQTNHPSQLEMDNLLTIQYLQQAAEHAHNQMKQQQQQQENENVDDELKKVDSSVLRMSDNEVIDEALLNAHQ